MKGKNILKGLNFLKLIIFTISSIFSDKIK